MKINTRVFGEIEVAEDKILVLDKGIIGFPELKHFILLHDEEKGPGVGIRFLQSIEESSFAMPVMDPLLIKEDYDPRVNDELLAGLGDLNQDNILVLVTVSIPSEITKMSVNLQAPFVINVEERKACQIVVEGNEYPVKFPIYDILQARKAGV